MRKTIRKVTIDEPLLMTSCHVSEKWKAGPMAAQTMMARTPIRNDAGDPTISAVRWANERKNVRISRPPTQERPYSADRLQQACVRNEGHLRVGKIRLGDQ